MHYCPRFNGILMSGKAEKMQFFISQGRCDITTCTKYHGLYEEIGIYVRDDGSLSDIPISRHALHLQHKPYVPRPRQSTAVLQLPEIADAVTIGDVDRCHPTATMSSYLSAAEPRKTWGEGPAGYRNHGCPRSHRHRHVQWHTTLDNPVGTLEFSFDGQG